MKKASPDGIVDADVHPFILPHEVAARLPETWRIRLERYGMRPPVPGAIYPRMRNGGYRADSWPEGSFPGNDVDLMIEQLLDRYGITSAVLIPLHAHAFGAEYPELAAALSEILNDWQEEKFLARDSRFVGSVCVPFETPSLAVGEIEARSGDPAFQQVLAPASTELQLGSSRYWPIYEAACAAGLPVSVHSGGVATYPLTGPPNYYLEEHVEFSGAMQAVVISLILGGVFDRFPDLKVVLVEGGVSWAGPLMWSMDELHRTWHRDLPILSRAPSEYFREHFWLTTQPIEEPTRTADLVTAVRHTGMADRILFASDYPHWDFDSPEHSLRGLPKALREKIFHRNAAGLYRSREKAVPA
ncbi:amidohydrolase [Amycolatopsis sp. WAC 04197]|uniref:amidohydrolase family protein n=1 Tax=Amycolatopsis sp. WAC 04197 TaxID=2203199 RepID=UPI000F78611A|nr:amidohydrolase family protein [Amycolatopsis sp. WAC 04197]RSN39075.1 amidohydrolase [Amycolatopsis sp. WAC 04197]